MTPDPSDNSSGQPKRGFGVQSVEVCMHLLNTLMEFGRPVSLKELAQAADISAQKAHRYLVSLLRFDMVEQNAPGGQYRLGEFALNVGLMALSQLDVVRIAGDTVSELRDRTDQSCLLAVWGNHGPTIVRMSEGPRPMITTARVGVVLSMSESATGRVFSAFFPKEKTRQFLASQLREEDQEQFDSLLADVRIRGLSRTKGKEQATINAISAPIFDSQGDVVGALTLLGSDTHFNVDWEGPAARELLARSKSVSSRLGYRETS
jgi:DNA-binding IclR family transcriptional regulator